MDEFHAKFSVGEVIGALVALSIAGWAWLVKKFGDRHLESIDEFREDFKEYRKESSQKMQTLMEQVLKLQGRIAILEAIGKRNRRHEDDGEEDA